MNFKLDLDRLHQTALNERPGRASGRTTLFIYQMIGVAQTGAFDFSKDHKLVYIVFNKPARTMMLPLLASVESICKSEGIPYKIEKDAKYIQILGTVFTFIKVDGVEYDNLDERCITQDTDHIWWYSDCCWDPAVDSRDVIDLATMNGASMGLTFAITTSENLRRKAEQDKW